MHKALCTQAMFDFFGPGRGFGLLILMLIAMPNNAVGVHVTGTFMVASIKAKDDSMLKCVPICSHLRKV